MVEWATRLQRAGIRTGILSNIGDSIAEGIIAKFPWLSGFDHCTWSHALFMAKPEPAIFLKTAAALNTALANILFIDDREDNIAAAAALGFQTIHYTNHPAFEQEMRKRGLTSLLTAGLPTAGCPTSRF
jgi:putative hydrolase of the HAD superfamily